MVNVLSQVQRCKAKHWPGDDRYKDKDAHRSLLPGGRMVNVMSQVQSQALARG
jgi:hypothetical protein